MGEEQVVMDFEHVESQLSITLPVRYKQVILQFGPRIWQLAVAKSPNDDCTDYYCIVTTQSMIQVNESQRYEDDPDVIPESIRNWWQTFFIIGSDGGSGYFLMNLDGDSHVYGFSTDSSEPIRKLGVSLEEFVSTHIRELEGDLDDEEMTEEDLRLLDDLEAEMDAENEA